MQAPSLYHHFGDRSGLIRAAVDAAFEEYFHRKNTATPADDADPRARVAAGWDAHIAFALAYPGLYPAMYPTSGPLPSQVERSGARLRAGFDELEQAGALRPGITAALATNALRAAPARCRPRRRRESRQRRQRRDIRRRPRRACPCARRGPAT
ncbi:TetR family transcriptional regulator [Streptomyces bingchenggensis BCW-1]|uniref:TetR family transcriptional regulator n=1 Tax=Streptomyces bingchenggensis (strain BCW-1) TaxID=749414 RepID=D7C7R5_STRBB|nr:TetR family transcriptional regulator [Streptomyces bingchenggensis BCW-1]